MTKSTLRWTIVALLLANLLFFYWHEVRVSETDTPANPTGQRLVLLSELKSRDKPAPVVVEPAEAAADSETIMAAEPEPESIAATEAETEAEAEIEPETAAEEVVAAIVQDATPTPPAVEEPDPVPEPPKEEAPSEPELGERLLQCWRTGPLDPVTEAYLLEAFAEYGVELRLQPGQVVVDTKYWVYVAVGDDKASRKLVRDKLLSEGIDNYIIAAGALKGDLSLGLFRERAGADALAEKRRKQGFPAKVYPVEKTEDRNWLLLDSDETEALGWPEDVGHIPGRPQLPLEIVPCPESKETGLQRPELYRLPAQSQWAWAG